ncbi:MAG: hypothetical protein CMG74_13235 [Candidatus Marinimicrobia bacterium]|nr:hypothetical protein [Candidatus Neomarinimicrobiota bacterium]|tara:strand:- start:62 stop:1039 length:978 start_codon:yes stop_codon:yes gene_type:complete
MKNNKEILITGGLGMIGSTLAVKLFKLGCNVTILDAELKRYGGNHYNINSIKDKIKYVKGDIRDIKTVDSLVLGKDIIFNFAAQVDYNYSLIDPILDNDINCKGHLNVLDSCNRLNKDVKLVYSGSRMQYGRINENPVTEDHIMDPLSVYGINKLAAEKYYLAYYKSYNINSVCFRITNPYGPRAQIKSPSYCILNWFIRQAMDGNDITIFGDGQQKRDYIYVDDIVDAMIKSAFNDKTNGNVYNLGYGKSIKFIDMAKLIISVVGRGKVLKTDWPKNWKNVETGSIQISIKKLINDINWSPKVEIEKGIKKTYEFYNTNKKHYW